MKLSFLAFATAGLSAVHAATTTTSSGAGTVVPADTGSTTTTGSGTAAPKVSSNSSSTGTAGGAIDSLKQKSYGSEYHMPYVRAVHARVQSDKPILVQGKFVSIYGSGDLAKGYQSAMDTVNTASVEGALMYVQAEGINQNSRAASDRCRRKNEMNYIVLYEVIISQTNETIAQFDKTWNVPEYGPMIPMDSGRCTPLTGETFPPECLQFNGVNGQPNIGPFVGAGLKNDDVRAPYPDTFWFSFPHTCPLKVWGEKADSNNACRAASRKGLCDLGVAPDGVTCTYAYDILGWVPIDDVVGITALKDDSGNAYKNFTTWCKASTDNVEFAGDDKTGKMTTGLPFWEDPLNSTRNGLRASKVIELYQQITSGDFKSTQIASTDLKAFKTLPSMDQLAAKNPPCYKSVATCNSGNGCKRVGFSQVCKPCTAKSDACKTDSSFTFPTLVKAKTTLSSSQLTSGSKLGGANGATGSITNSSNPAKSTSAAPTSYAALQTVFGMIAASAVAMLAL